MPKGVIHSCLLRAKKPLSYTRCRMKHLSTGQNIFLLYLNICQNFRH